MGKTKDTKNKVGSILGGAKNKGNVNVYSSANDNNIKRNSDTKNNNSRFVIAMSALSFVSLLITIAVISIYANRGNTVIADNNSVGIVGTHDINYRVNKTINNEFPVRYWGEVPESDRDYLIAQSFVLFPELFGNNYRYKYSRLREWLKNEHSIQHHSVKSLYTSIGQGLVQLDNGKYYDIPGIMNTYDIYANSVMNYLQETDYSLLSEYWKKDSIPEDKNKRFNIWLDLVSKEARKTLKNSPINEREWFSKYYDEYMNNGAV